MARPCPRCGEKIVILDSRVLTRLRCKKAGCGARPVLRHVLPYDPDCEPECFDDHHWYLGAPRGREATRTGPAIADGGT